MNPFEMMKNLQGLNQKAQEMQEQLKAIIVTGTSGAGLAEVKMNCDFEVTSIKIDPSIFNADNVQMAEVLLASAVNSAILEVKSKALEQARSSLAGMQI